MTIFLIVLARSFTADGNLLQPTGGVNRTPSHFTFFLVFVRMSNSVARDIGSRFGCPRTSSHVSSACCVLLDSLRLSLLLSHRLSHLPPSFSCSSSFSSMWVGSMRSPIRTSANGDLGTLAENNPLTHGRRGPGRTNIGSRAQDEVSPAVVG